MRSLANSAADLDQRIFSFQQELNKLQRARNERLLNRAQEDVQFQSQVQHLHSLLLSCHEQRALLSKETARCYEALEQGGESVTSPALSHEPSGANLVGPDKTDSSPILAVSRHIRVKREGSRSLFHYIHEVLTDHPQGLSIAEIVESLCRKYPQTFPDSPEERLRLRKSLTVTLNRYKAGVTRREGYRPSFADVFHRVGRGLFALNPGSTRF